MPNDKTISVAEALEIEATENSWINGGLRAVVRDIKPSGPGATKKFWRCTLVDEVNDRMTIGLSLFFAPKFSAGATIEITGKGIKRKEFRGDAEIGIGKDTEITTVTGRSSNPPPARQPSAAHNDSRESPPPPPEHEHPHPEDHAQHAPAPAPRWRPNGQTVGMALKEGLALLTRDMNGNEVRGQLKDPKFWKELHLVSSDLIRVSHWIEQGALAPLLRDRNAPKETPPAPPPRREAPPPPPPAQGENLDEDVPF